MNKIVKYVCSMTLVLPLLSAVSFADGLQWNMPYGLGSVQLPWKSTEVFYGVVRPIKNLKSGLTEEIAGASLPVLTIGRITISSSTVERIIDVQVGASGAWPVQSSPVNPYFAVGHDFVQDIALIPSLKALASNLPFSLDSAHLNAAVTYSTGLGAWLAGGTASYAFGGSMPSTPAVSTAFLSKPSYLSKLNLYNPLRLG